MNCCCYCYSRDRQKKKWMPCHDIPERKGFKEETVKKLRSRSDKAATDEVHQGLKHIPQRVESEISVSEGGTSKPRQEGAIMRNL